MDTLRTNEELQRIRAEIDRKHQAEEEAYGKRIMDEMAAADKYEHPTLTYHSFQPYTSVRAGV